jgi:hypothetical protein
MMFKFVPQNKIEQKILKKKKNLQSSKAKVLEILCFWENKALIEQEKHITHPYLKNYLLQKIRNKPTPQPLIKKKKEKHSQHLHPNSLAVSKTDRTKS